MPRRLSSGTTCSTKSSSPLGSDGAIYGTTVLLHDRFETGRTLAALMDAAARVTLVSLVPTMLARLLDAGLREPPTLRRVLLGGGPIPPALLARAFDTPVDVGL